MNNTEWIVILILNLITLFASIANIIIKLVK